MSKQRIERLSGGVIEFDEWHYGEIEHVAGTYLADGVARDEDEAFEMAIDYVMGGEQWS